MMTGMTPSGFRWSPWISRLFSGPFQEGFKKRGGSPSLTHLDSQSRESKLSWAFARSQVFGEARGIMLLLHIGAEHPKQPPNPSMKQVPKWLASAEIRSAETNPPKSALQRTLAQWTSKAKTGAQLHKTNCTIARSVGVTCIPKNCPSGFFSEDFF